MPWKWVQLPQDLLQPGELVRLLDAYNAFAGDLEGVCGHDRLICES